MIFCGLMKSPPWCSILMILPRLRCASSRIVLLKSGVLEHGILHSCAPRSKSVFLLPSQQDYPSSSLPPNSWMMRRSNCLDQQLNCWFVHISSNISILWCSSSSLPTGGWWRDCEPWLTQRLNGFDITIHGRELCLSKCTNFDRKYIILGRVALPNVGPESCSKRSGGLTSLRQGVLEPSSRFARHRARA